MPPALVDAAKQAEVAQLAFGADSIGGLSRLWARAVTQQGVASPDDLVRGYQAVTLDDVKRMARQLLDAPAVTVVETPGGPRRPASTASFGAPESFGSVPDHAVTLPDWAASALADLPGADGTAPPVATTLPNGLRLLVQPEHVTPTVSVFGRVREVSDTEEPPGQEGVSILTARLFGFGTETRDRIAFRTAVDDLAATANTGSSFGLKVLAPRFAEGMALLAENQLHPAFPADAFTVVRAQLAQALAGALQSPDYRTRLAREAALAPAGDPSLRQPTPAGVAALTLDDVRAYHARAFRPDLTTIVVVGDVTPEEALKVVTATFGGWTAAGPTPSIDLPPVGPNPPGAVRIPDAGSTQDAVTLAQTLPVPVDSPDRYRLNLGNTILGSGFSSRLYQDLRVRTGYRVQRQQRARLDPHPRPLHRVVRRRPRQGGGSPAAGGAELPRHGRRAGVGSGADPGQGAGAAPARDGQRQRARHRRRLPAPGGAGPAAGHRPARARPLPRHHRRRDPARLQQLRAARRLGAGGQGAARPVGLVNGPPVPTSPRTYGTYVGTHPMFIAMNRFKVLPGAEAEFEQLWLNRDSFLGGRPRASSSSTCCAARRRKATCCTPRTRSGGDKGAFEAWTTSEAFRSAHRGAGGSRPMYAGHPEFEGFEVIQTVTAPA